MKPFAFMLLCWFICSSVMEEPSSRAVFGVRVSVGANSQINSFVCYLDNGRVLSQKRVLDKETFIKIVSGYWPSPYNPQKKNLFEEHEIDCGVFMDSTTMEMAPFCIPLDSLWKIRFATYPFKGRSDRGWSQKLHMPSSKQHQYLSGRYGISHIDGDYFIDTSFWKLMTDVMDPVWVANYKSLE